MPHWAGAVTLETSGDEPHWARRYGGGLLMVLQEAAANALVRGFAASVRVRLEFSPHRLCMTVSDDGSGFDTSRDFGPGHLGLVNMRRRVEAMGGAFSIASVKGKGTKVSAEILNGDGR